MKNFFFAILAVFIIMPLSSALAEVNGGVNSYLLASGYDVAAQTTEQVVQAPGFQLQTWQNAIVGVWNGQAGVSQFTDYVRGQGYAIVNAGTDASVDAGYPGVTGASAGNSTAFSMPEVFGFMDNTVDLFASFGGSADGSSSSQIVILNN